MYTGKRIVYKKNNWISKEYIGNEFDKYVKRELPNHVNVRYIYTSSTIST